MGKCIVKEVKKVKETSNCVKWQAVTEPIGGNMNETNDFSIEKNLMRDNEDLVRITNQQKYYMKNKDKIKPEEAETKFTKMMWVETDWKRYDPLIFKTDPEDDFTIGDTYSLLIQDSDLMKKIKEVGDDRVVAIKVTVTDGDHIRSIIMNYSNRFSDFKLIITKYEIIVVDRNSFNAKAFTYTDFDKLEYCVSLAYLVE